MFLMSKAFTTKLSLPKFMAVAKSLSFRQQDLVRQMGFHHLLDLCCQSIPKNLILWLVKHFDVRSRTLNLPNGFSLTISSTLIHQLLGIPIGGLSVSKSCNDFMTDFIAKETNCVGKYPTINELKDLFSSTLDGEKFQRIFMLFTLSCFLCPSSNECASPEFCSAIFYPDKIKSYDWCTILLDKLVLSIHKFQESDNPCGTSALGGCVFVLPIIYLEFLDCADITLPDSIPRIRFWTTEIVKFLEESDALSDDSYNYGRLPMKDISCTAFRRKSVTESNIYYLPVELKQRLLLMFPEEHRANAAVQFQLIYEEMCKNSVRALEPVLINSITKMAELISKTYPNLIALILPLRIKLKMPQDALQMPLVLKIQHKEVDCTSENLSDLTMMMLNHHISNAQIGQTSTDKEEYVKIDELSCVVGHKKFPDPVNKPQIPLKKRPIPRNLDYESDFDGEISPTHSHKMSTMVRPRTGCARSLNERLHDSLAERKRLKSSINEFKLSNVCTDESKQSELGDSSVDGYGDWGPDVMKQVVQSMSVIEEIFSPQSQAIQSDIATSEANEKCHNMMNQQQVPLQPKMFYHVFVSNQVEKAVYQYIVARIPPRGAKSPTIAVINGSWVDHRTLGLSIQIYGSVNPYVMDIMGAAVMLDQHMKHDLQLIEPNSWSRYILKCDDAKLFQNPGLIPSDISKNFREPAIGFKLDAMDMILLPLKASGFWYLIVANFRHSRFEVLCPNEEIDAIKHDAETVIWNFKRTFKLAYNRSIRVDVYEMDTAFSCVSKNRKHNDSGVFVMELVQKYDGNTHLHFQPEHAKHIREILAYYIVGHKCNEKENPEIKQIIAQFA